MAGAPGPTVEMMVNQTKFPATISRARHRLARHSNKYRQK
jgi:hypothetical protein